MKSTQRFAMNATAFAVASALASGASAQALPTGFAPTPGSAATMTTPTASSMVVTQTSQRAIIDWTSFNIGAGNSVTFTQPAATSVAVNRVGAGVGQSTIDGMLSANGHVAILNPNGVLFGPTAIVNVGGLIASTGNLNDTTQFMSSATAPIAITGATAGSVTNKGSITIAGAGLAAFVAPSVANLGTITAASGRIMLGAAQAATISLNGGLYEMAIDKGVANPSISNTGTLSAPGGTIVLSALDAANVVSGLINLEGIQQANRIEVNGGRVTLASDLNAATVTGSSARVDVCGCGQIQDGIDIAATGATVNVAAGTFTQSQTLHVNKSITLAGAGEANTTVDSRAVTSSGGGYAMLVDADNVTLRDFTLYGPTVDAGNAYGIKVQPAGSAASSRLNNFTITRVTSRGAGRAELDLNGVNVAMIDHVTANGAPVGNDSGTTKGAGIQITDSANVTVRNSTTRNNAWGGVALFQTNRFFDQQTTGITVEGSNVLTESLPLYMQDESASKNFGALSLQGFSYAVKNSDAASGNNQYTWLQYTLGGAFDFAVNVPQSAQTTIQGWNVSAMDHNFYVGVGHLIGGGTRAMSVQQAVDVAVAGDMVNIAPGSYTEIARNKTIPGVGGTYDLGLYINKDNLTLRGIDAAGNPITRAADVQAWITAGASTNFGMNHGIGSNNVTIEGLGFKPYAPAPNKTIEIAGDNFTFRNSVVDNRTADGGAGALYFGELDSNHQIGRLTVTGSIFYDGSVSLANGVGVAADGHTYQPTADRMVTNNAFIGSDNYTFGGLLLSGKMDEVPWRPLPIGAAIVTGNSFSGFDESVLVRGEQQGVDLRAVMRDNTFDHAVLVTDASGNVRPGQYLSLSNVARDKYTIQSSVQAGVDRAQSGDTVSVGAGTYAEEVVVNGPRNLSFGGPTIHSLTVNANSGIGGTATADGAGGFRFNAPMVLLGDTSLATMGSGIAFNGNITTLGNNPYALNLDAGAGNITLTSGGSETMPLGAFSTNSGSFNLLGTLWVTGFGVNSLGPVALSNHSLHAVGGGPNVIIAGGDVTGTASSTGNVSIDSGGNVVATVSGNSIVITADQAVNVTINAPTAVEIHASVPITVTGSVPTLVVDIPTGTLITLNTTTPVEIHASAPITVTGSAPSLVVNAPGASVTGDFKKVSNTGAGIVQVNGAKQPPDALAAAANGNRILPAETTIIRNVSGNPRVSTMPVVPDTSHAGTVRAAPVDAADLLQSGATVELDLSGRN